MIVKFGGIVTEARGKCGDVVYSRGHYGACAHAYAPPYSVHPGPISSMQQTRRNQWALARAGWQTIGDEARLAWRSFAELYSHTNRFGDKSPLTGHNVFCQLNMRRVIMSLPPLTLPPTYAPTSLLQDIDSFSVTTTPEILFSVQPIITDTDYNFFIWATPNMNAGRNYPQPFTCLIKTQQCNGLNSFDVFSDWTAYFGGSPILNKRIFILVQIVHRLSGFCSPKLLRSAIVQTP